MQGLRMRRTGWTRSINIVTHFLMWGLFLALQEGFFHFPSPFSLVYGAAAWQLSEHVARRLDIYNIHANLKRLLDEQHQRDIRK